MIIKKYFANIIIYNSVLEMQGEARSREKMKPEKMKNCWQLEIHNLPQHCNKEDLTHFLWKTLQSCKGLLKHSNPIIESSFELLPQKKLTILFRSFEEAINCLQLDRIYYGKKVLGITSRYLNKPAMPTINTERLKKVGNKSYDEFCKIFVANLPCMPQHQIMNLLSEFGQLKYFCDLTKDNNGSECFCEYTTDDATEEAMKRINASKIRGRQLIAKRAALMGKQVANNKTKVTLESKKVLSKFEKDMNEFYATFDTVGFFKNKNLSCVLLLKSVISPNSNVQATLSDIKKEVSRIGPISRIAHRGYNVYIEYERLEYAQIAYLLLMNKKYDGKGLDLSFYDPIKFADDILL